VRRNAACEQAADNSPEWRGAGEHVEGAGKTGAGRGLKSTADDIPVNAEFASGRTGGFNEAHFEKNLLRLRDANGIDHFRTKLLGDGDGLVERDAVRRRA